MRVKALKSNKNWWFCDKNKLHHKGIFLSFFFDTSSNKTVKARFLFFLKKKQFRSWKIWFFAKIIFSQVNNFFCTKYLHFLTPQNSHVIYFRITTKDVLMELSQKLWQKIRFSPNLGSFKAHFWIFKIVGNRQTDKSMIKTNRKAHLDHISPVRSFWMAVGGGILKSKGDFYLAWFLSNIFTFRKLDIFVEVSVVASMLVSPIMGPVLGCTLGFVLQDWDLMYKGFITEITSLLICIVVGFAVTTLKKKDIVVCRMR